MTSSIRSYEEIAVDKQSAEPLVRQGGSQNASLMHSTFDVLHSNVGDEGVDFLTNLHFGEEEEHDEDKDETKSKVEWLVYLLGVAAK